MGPTARQLEDSGGRPVAEAPERLTGVEPTSSGQRLLVPVVARRSASGGGPTMTAAQRNVRPFEATHDGAPAEPVRYGDVPARPSRQPVVTFLSLAGIKAVMRDEFWINLWRRPPIAGRPRGQQHPWLERVNVHRPPSDTYGSQFVLDPSGGPAFTTEVFAGMP